MILDSSDLLSVEPKYFNYWNDSANHVVEKIFNFSEMQGHSSLGESVVNTVNFLRQNQYFFKYDYNVTDELSLLKSIIDFYLESKVWMHEPVYLMGTSSTHTVNHAIEIHQSHFYIISHCAIRMFNQLKETELNKLTTTISSEIITDIIIKKQHDYGPNNISKFGIFGLIVRLHDKIARIENLLSANRNGNNAVKDETIYDTIIDIIGYSSVMMLWLNGWFILPMRNE